MKQGKMSSALSEYNMKMPVSYPELKTDKYITKSVGDVAGKQPPSASLQEYFENYRTRHTIAEKDRGPSL